MAEKKKIINKFEIGITILAFFIITYLFLQSKGINLTQKTETIEITDNPTSKRGYDKEKRAAERSKRDHEVENMLRKIDGRNKNRDYAPEPVVNAHDGSAKRTADEERFFNKVKSKYVDIAKKDESVDLYHILKSSKNTYLKVRDFFQDPADKDKSEVEKIAEDVGFLLQNKSIANNIYQQIEDQFGIPAEKSKDFATKGKKAISDWAEVVEKNKE